MLAVSVIMEYNDLTERFQQLENNVSTSLRMAINSSTASEELFSSDYQDRMSSYGVTNSDSASLTSSSVILYRDGLWYHGNTYVLAKYYEDNGRFPVNDIEYNSYASSFGTEEIYEWLFGNAGQSYTNSALAWGNKSQTITNALSGVSTSRTPTAKFADFYKNIGQQIKTKGIVRAKSGADDYTVEQKEYSVLDNMGLDFSGVSSSSLTGLSTQYLTDNFSMSVHVGKSTIGSSDTIYYITPYSLGVTYVPEEILKPTFLANLDSTIRLQKLASGYIENMSEAKIREILESADGCTSTSVYEDSTVSTSHLSTSDYIVNDGSVEYDLQNIEIRVDYFVVDFYNENNRDVVSSIEGSIGGYEFNGAHKGKTQTEILRATVNALKNSDTNRYGINYINGNRIVAKVTVRVKCYVPYQSSLLQWLCRRDWDGTSDNHYSIKMWNPSTNTLSDGADGVWYQYSTYTAITR